MQVTGQNIMQMNQSGAHLVDKKDSESMKTETAFILINGKLETIAIEANRGADARHMSQI